MGISVSICLASLLADNVSLSSFPVILICSRVNPGISTMTRTFMFSVSTSTCDSCSGVSGSYGCGFSGLSGSGLFPHSRITGFPSGPVVML